MTKSESFVNIIPKIHVCDVPYLCHIRDVVPYVRSPRQTTTGFELGSVVWTIRSLSLLSAVTMRRGSRGSVTHVFMVDEQFC